MFGKKTIRKGRARTRYVVTVDGHSTTVNTPDQVTALTRKAKAAGQQATWRKA